MLYRSLELKQSASAEEIRASYRRLALQHHPDRCGGTDEAIQRFQEIQKAYEVLSSEERRAAYDDEIRAKRAKFKGFVKPPPFDAGAVEKPVGYKLIDESMYTFESAPSRTHSGWNYGDILGQKDRSGCYVGVAADGWHYWCVSGTSHAARLCQAASSFGMSDVKVLYRCNLSARPVGTGAASAPPRRPRTEKEKSEGKKKLEQMKKALQQKERDRAVPRLMDRVVFDERAERNELEGALWVKLDELHATAGTLLHCLESGLPMPDIGREWLNRSCGGDGWLSPSDTLTSPAGATYTSSPGAAAEKEDCASNRFSDHFSGDCARSREASQTDEDDAHSSTAGVEAPEAAADATTERDILNSQCSPLPLPAVNGRAAMQNASLATDNVTLDSIQFRYTSSCHAVSSQGADVSYQFQEASDIPDHTSDESSLVYVDLTGDADDLFDFTEEGGQGEGHTTANTTATLAPPPPISGEPAAGATSVARAAGGEGRSKTRAPTDGSRGASPAGATTTSHANHLSPTDTTPTAALNHSPAVGQLPIRSGSPRTAVTHTPAAGSSHVRPGTAASQPPPDQLASLTHFLMSRTSSSGNLLVSPSNNGHSPAVTPKGGATQHNTPPHTTTTTTVASTTATASLPPPSVVVASAASPRLACGDAQPTSATFETTPSGDSGSRHVNPEVGVLSLSIPTTTGGTSANGLSAKRGATYPWTTSPLVNDNIDVADGGRSPVTSSMRGPLGTAEDDPNASSGHHSTADATGVTSAPNGSASNTVTPASAHLGSGSVPRRTPRFMQATKSYSNRTNGSVRFTPLSNSISPRCDSTTAEGDGLGPAATTGPAQAAATGSAAGTHAQKTAQQMFAEEMAFMKEFEAKRKMKR